MNIIFRITFIIIMLFANSKLFSQKNSLPVFTAQMDGWHKADAENRLYPNDTTTYLHVKTSIKNNSSDTLYYLIWTCSWDMFYIIDSKDVQLPGSVCTRNGLTLRKIAPHQSAERLLLLEPLSMWELKGKDLIKSTAKQVQDVKLKIGFKLYTVPPNEIENIQYGNLWKYETPKNETILWSGLLELK